jgi:hypothetical protein
MSDHYVRHLLRPGDYVRTEFQCRAPETAPCRTMCRRCIIDEQREQCDCDYVTEKGDWDESDDEKIGREPALEHGRPCNILAWLENDAPEECYNGEEAPVRGPGWQPIIPEWNGDNYDWDYAPEPVEEQENHG